MDSHCTKVFAIMAGILTSRRWGGACGFARGDRVGRGALTPGEDQQRQREQLEAGADQVRGRVAEKVRYPSQRRLEDRPARGGEQVVGGQDRRPLRGGNQAVEERLPDRRGGGEDDRPAREQEE